MARQRKAEPRELTRDWVERTALEYLNRFDSSTQNLKRVLARRAERLAKEQDVDLDVVRQWIAETLQRYQSSGLLDDARFAATMARSLRDRGASRRAIEQKLMSRGVPRDTIGAVVQELDATVTGAELDAARRYVKRRRLGPYRSRADVKTRHKDLAALARAGFDRDTALAALELEREGAEEF